MKNRNRINELTEKRNDALDLPTHKVSEQGTVGKLRTRNGRPVFDEHQQPIYVRLTPEEAEEYWAQQERSENAADEILSPREQLEKLVKQLNSVELIKGDISEQIAQLEEIVRQKEERDAAAAEERRLEQERKDALADLADLAYQRFNNAHPSLERGARKRTEYADSEANADSESSVNSPRFSRRVKVGAAAVGALVVTGGLISGASQVSSGAELNLFSFGSQEKNAEISASDILSDNCIADEKAPLTTSKVSSTEDVHWTYTQTQDGSAVDKVVMATTADGKEVYPFVAFEQAIVNYNVCTDTPDDFITVKTNGDTTEIIADMDAAVPVYNFQVNPDSTIQDVAPVRTFVFEAQQPDAAGNGEIAAAEAERLAAIMNDPAKLKTIEDASFSHIANAIKNPEFKNTLTPEQATDGHPLDTKLQSLDDAVEDMLIAKVTELIGKEPVVTVSGGEPTVEALQYVGAQVAEIEKVKLDDASLKVDVIKEK